MIEALYKKTIIFFMIINSCFFASSEIIQNHIFPIYIPYQESRISVGINIYDYNDDLEFSYLFNNWFTNNLYFNSTFNSFDYKNDLKIKYILNIGYAYNFEKKIFNNIVFNIAYDRMRFENEINDDKNIIYSILTNLKINKIWLSISSSFIHGLFDIKQYALNVIKPINKKFIILFGYKVDINENNNSLETPYISIRYNL